VALILHICAMVAAGLLNRNTSLTALGGLYANAGFCLLCAALYTHFKEDFFRTGFVFFAILALWGVTTVYIFPYGFLKSGTVYDAIYGLGAKNNAFPFYFALIFFSLLVLKNKQKLLFIPIAIMATVIAGYICGSTNTIICMILVLMLYLVAAFLRRIFTKLNPVVFLIAFVAIIALIYEGLESELIAGVLAKFKRSLTFSGRNVLWQQAVEYFSNSPLIGVGSEIIYTLVNKVTTAHAHSQWLDKLAKYGIIPLIFLVFVVLRTFIKSRKTVNREKANLLCGMLLIYMLHMSFDTYNYNFFTLFIIVANCIMDDETVQQPESEKVL
jgi:O-antigen ligase